MQRRDLVHIDVGDGVTVKVEVNSDVDILGVGVTVNGQGVWFDDLRYDLIGTWEEFRPDEWMSTIEARAPSLFGRGDTPKFLDANDRVRAWSMHAPDPESVAAALALARFSGVIE